MLCSEPMASDGRIAFTPSEQNRKYLEQLRRMGVYGKKTGDVINFILGKEIMALLQAKTLERLPTAEEVPEEEDSGA